MGQFAGKQPQFMEKTHDFLWIFGAERAGLINEALPLAHSRGAIQT